MKRNVVALGQGGEVWVVRDDARDSNGQNTSGLSKQNRVEAVADLADHQHDFGFIVSVMQVPLGIQAAANRLERCFNIVVSLYWTLSCCCKVSAQKEMICCWVAELR